MSEKIELNKTKIISKLKNELQDTSHSNERTATTLEHYELK